MRILTIFLFLTLRYVSLATGQDYGYAIVQNDTIYGKIQINFDTGSVVVKQDSVNRMFITNIQSITLQNDSRDTYYVFDINHKNEFFKLIVDGDQPLLKKEDAYFTLKAGLPIALIEEKLLYQLFGKKQVKEYAFIRNLTISEKAGLIDLFKYFNEYKHI